MLIISLLRGALLIFCFALATKLGLGRRFGFQRFARCDRCDVVECLARFLRAPTHVGLKIGSPPPSNDGALRERIALQPFAAHPLNNYPKGRLEFCGTAGDLLSQRRHIVFMPAEFKCWILGSSFACCRIERPPSNQGLARLYLTASNMVSGYKS